MDSYEPQAVLFIARQLRAALPQMGEQARALIPQLDDLLARAEAGEDVDARTLELLSSHPHLRRWLHRALVRREDLMIEAVTLPGESEVEATAYRCPRCGWVYRLPQKGYPVPPCPVDGSELEPKRKEEGE